LRTRYGEIPDRSIPNSQRYPDDADAPSGYACAKYGRRNDP
jgi:hypothetical protein